MRRELVSLLSVALLSIGATRPKKSDPAQTNKPPSETDLIRALPEEERQWLTEFVASIILPEERKVFLELAEPYQREAFKLDFWARRERSDLPPPLGPRYRERYEEVWKLADEAYGGWRNDAGRILLRWGEPAEILKPTCGGEEVFNGLEVWTYNNLGYSGRGSARNIFYRRFINGPYWLWSLNDRNSDIFRQNSCRRSFPALRKDCMPAAVDQCATCEDRCRVYKAYLEIRDRQGSPLGAMTEQARLLEPAKVSTEGLERQKDRWATTSNPNAKIIRVEGPSSSAAALAPSPTPTRLTPSAPAHRLSTAEVRERIEQLEPKYREWLDLATPLISDEDLSLFLQLSPHEKDEFIRKFWKTRS
jgi:GWxTD domain-containing protein